MGGRGGDTRARRPLFPLRGFFGAAGGFGELHGRANADVPALFQHGTNRVRILPEIQHRHDRDRFTIEEIENAEGKTSQGEVAKLAVRFAKAFGHALNRRDGRNGAGEKHAAQAGRDGFVFADGDRDVPFSARADDQPVRFPKPARRRLASSHELPSAGFARYSA